MRGLSSFSIIGPAAILMLLAISMGAGCAATKLPGTSGADAQLQRDVTQMIWFLDSIEDSECDEREIINTEISYGSEVPSSRPHPEKWTVNRCGEIVYYSVKFTPTPADGGTDFAVSLLDEK